MIDPTEDDIGRSVIYRGGAGEIEEGVITSFNSEFVFVRYKKQHPSAPGQATDRRSLSFAHA